ncbi:MAG: dihydrofolate reductase [Tidjanibacter sp.]|nr:dihydrofolate reductase [Tidjanibacter sp.]
MSSKVSLIVAVAKNGVIGTGGTMPWHITEDFAHFKAVTLGHSVVMGRKTYESIGRPLPRRRNIVITRNAELSIEGCEMATSLEAALAMCEGEEEVFVIGGGEIYRQAMPLADKLYITHVGIEVEGDTCFPDIDPTVWREVCREDFERGKDFEHPFSFVDYERL